MKQSTEIRASLIFAIFSSLVVLYLVHYFTSTWLTIKASYTTIGLIIGILIIESNGRLGLFGDVLQGLEARWCGRIVVILSMLSISTLILFRSIPLVVFLTSLGYVFLVLQFIRFDRVSPQLISQLILLFAINSFTKLYTTYFYIGSLDLIKHTRNVLGLLESHRISSIPDIYAKFPILHISSGSISLLTDVSPHDSIILLGIVLFSVGLVVLYILLKEYIGGQKLPFVTTLLVSVSPLYIYFSNYFFPQSFALVMFYLFIFAAVGSVYRRDKRYMTISFVITSSLIFLHHFTMVLMLPIVLVMVITLNERNEWLESISNTLKQTIFFCSLPYLTSVYYWSTEGQGFITGLLNITVYVISTFMMKGITTGGTEVTQGFYHLGVEPVEKTPMNAFEWLFSVVGITEILLVTSLVIGAVAILFTDHSSKIAPLVGLGLVGSLLILETPITIKSMDRLAFPFSVFVYLVVGYGLMWLLENTDVSRSSMILIFVLLLSFVGPLTAVDDVENYRGTVDPKQTSISESEYAQLTTVARFHRSFETGSVGSFLVIRQMLHLFKIPVASSDSVSINESRLRATDIFLYNDNWNKYQLRYASGETNMKVNHVRMSSEWLNTQVSLSNKLYSSGELGLIRSR